MWLTNTVTNRLILVYEATTIRYEYVWITVRCHSKTAIHRVITIKTTTHLTIHCCFFASYLWQMGQIGVINLSSQILFKGIRYSSTKPTWLVVLTILKNMSSSMGWMTSHIWNIKFMFETTKATDFIHHFPSSAVFFPGSPRETSSGWGRGKPRWSPRYASCWPPPVSSDFPETSWTAMNHGLSLTLLHS